MTTACVLFKQQQPTAQMHAVTDGSLTLGAVASENDEDLKVYRLLLCKNFTTYNTSMLNDDKVCKAALVDDAQREVVIVPDKMRRSFGAKLRRHALLIAGLAVTAAAISYVGYKLIARTSKKAKAIGKKNINAAYEKKLALEKRTYDKIVAEVSNELKKTKLDEVKRQELLKKLHLSLSTASEYHLNQVLTDIRAIDSGVAAELEMGIFGGKVNAKVLENFASKVENLDAAFAERLRAAKLINIQLQDDGLLYFSSVAEQTFKMKKTNNTLTTKLKNLENANNVSVDYFNKEEKLFLHQLNQVIANLLSASLLRSLEIEKDILLKLKSKSITASHITDTLKGELAEITHEYVWKIDNIEAYHQRVAGTITKITQGEDGDILNYANILQSYEMISDLDFQKIRLLSKRDAYRGATENVVKHIGNSSLEGNIDNRVRQLNIRIAKTSETLFNNTLDTVEEGHYAAREIELWSELAAVRNKSEKIRQEKLNQLKKEVETLEQQLIDKQNALSKERNTINKISEEAAERKKLIFTRQEEALKELKKAEDLLRKKQDEEFVVLSKKADTDRRNLLTLGAGGMGIASASVMLAIDKSIFWYGEQQLGEHWNQIFSEKSSFDNATEVKDINSVLEKLAAVFNFKVNSAALALTD